MALTRHKARTALAGVALATTAALALAGCSGNTAQSASGSGGGGGDCTPAKQVTIAYQPGLGYAPLLVAKQQKTLEKALPDTKVKWMELNSGSAIRDGIVAGKIQVGAGGIGPFLVGYDAGIDWKVVTGMNDMNLYLMTMKSNIQSLKDLKGAGGIAMPGPDSIQSVILRKGAEEQLGDAHALDSQIVAMGHPDGVQALVAGQIAAHLTSPPFQSEEAAKGAHRILASYDLFGEHTFNSVFTQTSFEKCNTKFVDTLVGAIKDADQQLTDDPDQSAQILAKATGESVSDLKAQITADDVKFVTTPKGFGTFATFMQKIGLIKKVPDTKDLFFQNSATEGAS